MKINVLITSAGRRVELVNCFKAAKKKLNIQGVIVAADLSDSAPACFYADKQYQVCRIDNDDYVNQIIRICKEEEIDLIVPTIDTELQKFADNKKLIEESTYARVLVSDKCVIDICRNKYNTVDFFLNNGFHAPKYLSQDEINAGEYAFPMFIKPLNGSSSINAFKVHNERELEFFTEYIENYILQEYADGIEYTIDAFCDFEGNPITIVPRRRLAVRSGEILKGITEKNRIIIDEVKRVISVLKPIGQITLQGMLLSNDTFSFIEINPRFGGGAPMSIAAGADSCCNLYRLLSGEKLEYNEDYEDGLMSVRFDQAIFLKDGKQVK